MLIFIDNLIVTFNAPLDIFIIFSYLLILLIHLYVIIIIYLFQHFILIKINQMYLMFIIFYHLFNLLLTI